MQRRKTSARGRGMKNARGGRDGTLREFKERDLGGDIESSGVAVVVRPQRPTSILLSDELKAALRKRGQELGVGYQTAAKMILAKYINAKCSVNPRSRDGSLPAKEWLGSSRGDARRPSSRSGTPPSS